MPTRQVYRTLVATDIESYGRRDRDDLVRVRLRSVLRDVLGRAFVAAGVPADAWTATSTGDGLLGFIDPSVEAARALRAILDHMPRMVADYNRSEEPAARLRVRAVLHAAYVVLDADGVAGEQVNLAFRLLDSDPLRAYLRSAAGPMVIAVTDHVYEQVVRHRIYGLDPAAFEPFQVEVKETRATGWAHATDDLPAAGELTADGVLPHDSDVIASRFNRDGTVLATVTAGRSVWTWDIRSGEQLLRCLVPERVLALGCDARGEYVVATGAGHLTRVLDLAAGAERHRYTHDDQVNQAAFSPDGRLLVTASADGTARVWQVEDGREVRRLPHPAWVVSAEFSEDAQRVLTTSADGTARVWDEAGREVARYPHAGRVLFGTLSPDQRLVVTTTTDAVARVWHQAGHPGVTLGHDDRVNHAVFSRDGRLLVTASADGTARVWEMAGAREIARFSHTGRVLSVALSPDQRLVVTGSSSREGQAWDVLTGELRLHLGKDQLNAEFSRDGGYLATFGDRMARIWRLR